MNKYTVDLPTSKKLAPLLPVGYESEHYLTKEGYLLTKLKGDCECDSKYYHSVTKCLHPWESVGYPIYPALILAEVLEVLPYCIKLTVVMEAFEEFPERRDDALHHLWVNKKEAGFIDTLGDISWHNNAYFKVNDKTNLATAAAQLYIWLVENGYKLEAPNENTRS
jgi:hypothetical protein